VLNVAAFSFADSGGDILSPVKIPSSH
jgi:hypothetical protein